MPDQLIAPALKLRRERRRCRAITTGSKNDGVNAWVWRYAPEIRVGKLAIPLDTIEIVDLTPANFDGLKLQILAVEQDRYGASAPYPPDVLRSGQRPLLQFPLETLEARH